MKNQTFMVIVGLNLPCDVILGRDCLAENNIIVDVKNKALHHRRIQAETEDFNYTIKTLDNETRMLFEEVPVTLTQEVHLEPNSWAKLRCKIERVFMQI